MTWVTSLLVAFASSAGAVNYEVYPGSAFYLPQMLDRTQWSYVATNANGLYHHPVGFNDLTAVEEATYTGHFTNRFAMVEGDMGSGSTTGDVANLQAMWAYGLTPVAAFVNRPSSNASVWRQLVRNNAAQSAPSYEMLAPHRLDDTVQGWNDPKWNYARTNMQVAGCIGSGVDAPVYLFVHEAAAYRQSIYDMRDWTVANGRKFNYLLSPNNSYNSALLGDTQTTVRAMEDTGHEADVYGVVLYGERPVDLVPEKVNVGGADRAATTITGLAYWLLKHRDGEPGTLDLSALRSGVTSGAGVMSPVLSNTQQTIALSTTAARSYTLQLDNSSPWLDYAGVLRARAFGSPQDWTITFTKGGQDITSQVLSNNGRLFVGTDRWMPGAHQEVTLTVTPKASPGPLKLVIEALPHAGVDHALDVLSFESAAVGNTAPTLALPTTPALTREALPCGPIWFTCGDAETLSDTLSVSVSSSNTALVPNANLQLGQSGIQRWLRLVPVAGQWGSSLISVTVSDGTTSITKTFTLTVERTTILPVVKANNTSGLDLGTSWQVGSVPALNDQAVWDSTVTSANTVGLAIDLELGGLRITSPGGTVTINGPSRLSLGVAGVDLSTSTRDLILNAPTDLDESATWSVAVNRFIRANVGLDGIGGIAKSGSGRLELLGTDTFVGALSALAGELVKTGGGAQSSTTVSGNAILRVSHPSGFGAGGLSISAANSSTGRVELSGGISVLAGKPVTINSRSGTSDAIVSTSGINTMGGSVSLSTGGSYYGFRSDSGLLTLSGTVSSIATGTRNFTLGGAADGRLTGAVSNGSGTVGLFKSGQGTWTIEGTNSFTGPVVIQQGTLGVVSALPSQPVTVNAGATLSGSAALGGTVQVDGRHSPGVQSITGPLTYGSAARLVWEIGDSVTASTVTVSPGALIEVLANGPGSAVDFRDSAWRNARQWTVLSATSISGGFGLGTVSADASGDPAGPFGSFSISSSPTSVVLQWTPGTAFQIWQYDQFGSNWNSSSIAGPTADPDGDGWSNQDEWVIGSHPLNAASRFTTSLSTSGITFTRTAGRAYRVETSTTLSSGWTLLANVAAGTGPITVPPPVNPGPKRFYRVVISYSP